MAIIKKKTTYKKRKDYPYLGSRAKRRLVNTSSIIWYWRDVIVAVKLRELKDSSFKGFICQNSIREELPSSIQKKRLAIKDKIKKNKRILQIEITSGIIETVYSI